MDKLAYQLCRRDLARLRGWGGGMSRKTSPSRKTYRCPLHLLWSPQPISNPAQYPRSLPTTICPIHGATQISGLCLPTLGPRLQGLLAQFPMGS